jgi:transcriptional regulator with XRE-family HTH domain
VIQACQELHTDNFQVFYRKVWNTRQNSVNIKAKIRINSLEKGDKMFSEQILRRLGSAIKKYRIDHNNMSLRDFAKQCGVSHSHVDSIEKGIDPKTGKLPSPGLVILEKIANGMGKDLLTVIGIKDIHELFIERHHIMDLGALADPGILKRIKENFLPIIREKALLLFGPTSGAVELIDNIDSVPIEAQIILLSDIIEQVNVSNDSIKVRLNETNPEVTKMIEKIKNLPVEDRKAVLHALIDL